MEGKITFYLGEVKFITASVASQNPNETIIITDAKYELRSVRTKETVKSGECSVSGNEISLLLDIAQAGVYELKLTVRVGAETFIQKTFIYVEG